MYAGGNNFGRTAGDAITTAYATDVNVCPDGLPNEPKFTHLGNAAAASASAAKILLEDDPQANAAVPLAHAPVLVGDEDGDGTWDGPRERDEDDASIGKKKTETKTRTDSGGARVVRRRSPRGDSPGVVAAIRTRARARATVGGDDGGSRSLVVARVYRSSDGSAFAAFWRITATGRRRADFQGGSFRLNGRSSVFVLGDEAAASRGEASIRVAFNSSDVRSSRRFERCRRLTASRGGVDGRNPPSTSRMANPGAFLGDQVAPRAAGGDHRRRHRVHVVPRRV